MQSLSDIVTEVMELLQTALRESADGQGHRLTGKLSDSIQFTVSQDGTKVTGTMVAESYAGALEFGVSASRIPYSGRTGKGGTSLYIQGLIDFFEKRGLSGREAIGAAFATATVHKREGMATRASSRFSQDGKRSGFIKAAIDNNIDKMSDLITKRYGAVIELNFGSILKQYENIKIVG